MKKQVSAEIPTKWGIFQMILFAEDTEDRNPHFVLMHKDCLSQDSVLVRIHSECLTGDLLGSLRCDCGEQLDRSLQKIFEQMGLLIYLRQEGRGIGLINKLKAYNLQDEGMNTFDANIHLGFEADERHYNLALDILSQLGIKRIELITNNPSKIDAIEQSDIELVNRIPIIMPYKSENRRYMEAKKEVMGHLFDDK